MPVRAITMKFPVSIIIGLGLESSICRSLKIEPHVAQLMLIAFSKADGGETGIRTLDTLRYTRFPSVRLQPLGHLSAPQNLLKIRLTNLFEANTFAGFSSGSRRHGACA